MNTRFLANRLDAGLISGVSGILDFVTGQSGYIKDLYITGEGGDWCKVQCATPFSCDDLTGCANISVTGYLSGSGLYVGGCTLTVSGGRIGINTCEPKCDVEIYGNVCHTSGHYTNYSGQVSGQSGVFDWVSGNSGYLKNELTVGTGDCVFIVTTGGLIGINTCDPKCDVEIYGNVCHASGHYTNYSGQVSGQSGVFDWVSGNSGCFKNELTVGTGPDIGLYANESGNVGVGFSGYKNYPIQAQLQVSGSCIISGSNIFSLDYDRLPKSDPSVRGRVWVDESGGDLLKISRGV